MNHSHCYTYQEKLMFHLAYDHVFQKTIFHYIQCHAEIVVIFILWIFKSFIMRLCYFHKDIGLVVKFRYLKFSIWIFFLKILYFIYLDIQDLSVLHLYINYFYSIWVGSTFFYCLHCPCSSKDISISSVFEIL